MGDSLPGSSSTDHRRGASHVDVSPESQQADERRSVNFRLSVIVVTYDSADHIAACLSSMEAHAADERISLEIFVVDNGSSDDSLTIAARESPDAIVWESPGNVGFAAACNAAIARSTSDYILLLNPDCLYLRGSLALALQTLAADSSLGVLGCRLEKEDGTLDHACKRSFPTPWDSAAYFLRLDRIFKSSHRFGRYAGRSIAEDEPALVDAINGAFMLVKRSAIAEVGTLDERYWMYAEDLDWCWRFKERGYGVMYWPSLVFLHVKGASSRGGRPFRLNWAFHRAMWLFYVKFHRGVSSPVTIGLVGLGIGGRFLGSALIHALSRLRRRVPEVT